MIYFLILLSYFLVALNFDAPERVSNLSNIVIVLEHTAVLLVAKLIIKKQLGKVGLARRYYLFFLVSYCISILYLYTEWSDNLYKTFSTGWDAFDPIKYYSMAVVSIKSGYLFDGMMYFPCAYVFYGIMKVLGINPLVPLFVNEIVFVYAVCLIAKHINVNTPHHLKYYSWLMLIPEVICFNVTSSKDILCCLCATIICVKAAELLKSKITIGNLFVIGVTFAVFALARLSLAMASICGVILTVVFSNKMSKKTILLIALAGAMVAGAFTISNTTEVSADAVTERVEKQSSGDMSSSSDLVGQSSNSFARKIIPHNAVESIVFGFIRSICYVVIDPRFVKAPINTLVPFQGLTMLILVDYTTLLMCISSYFIFFWITKRYKKEDACVKEIFIVGALYWYAVGTFNPLMIHVRYRLVYDILFFAIAIRAYLTRPHKKTGIYGK